MQKKMLVKGKLTTGDRYTHFAFYMTILILFFFLML